MWLAGLLEGEGCFSISRHGSAKPGVWRTPVISVCSTDKDVIDHCALLMDGKARPSLVGKPGRKDVFVCVICGDKALGLMSLLKPFMCSRRQQRISEVIALAANRPGSPRGELAGGSKLTGEKVMKIRKLALSGGYGTRSRLAREFGISPANVHRILNNQTWRHIL